MITQGTVAVFHTCKEGLHVVIVELSDRVKLVIMTPRTTNGQPQNRITGPRDNLIQCVLTRQPFGGIISTDLPGKQHRRSDQKSCRSILTQHVPGDLFPHKSVIRPIFVERPYHIVPVGPRMFTRRVDFKAMCVRIPHHIQPVLRPTLAVMTTGQ